MFLSLSSVTVIPAIPKSDLPDCTEVMIASKSISSITSFLPSLSAIAAAELSELERHLPKDAAMAVYRHFRKEGEGSDK